MGALSAGASEVTDELHIGGMTCSSCAETVKAALESVPGVKSVKVDLGEATAFVQRSVAVSSAEELRQAVHRSGYSVRRTVAGTPLRRPIIFGLLAVAGLLTFYLGVISLAQGWDHAVQQLIDDRWFIAAIAGGFGTQIGLFTYLRGLHRRAPAGGVAASTGTSTAAMLACCAHHLSDVLPIIGISGAAIFLDQYKTPLLWLGIAMTTAGVSYMLWQINWQRRMACRSGTVAESTT